MAYFTKGFTVSVMFSFILLVSALYLWANQTYLTATPEQVNETLQEIEAQRKEITVASVFLNNLFVSWFLVVPIIGLMLFAFVWYNTACVIGVLAQAYDISPATYVFSLTILAFLEIFAYSLLLGESLYITFLGLLKSGAKERVKTQSWKTFLLYILLLFFGALTEMIYIG